MLRLSDINVRKNLQCIKKNTIVFGEMVEKKTETWYFCNAKHNSINADVRRCG